MVKFLIKIFLVKRPVSSLLALEIFLSPAQPWHEWSKHCGLSLVFGEIADLMANFWGPGQLYIMGNNTRTSHFTCKRKKKFKALRALMMSWTHKMFWWVWWGAGIHASPESTRTALCMLTLPLQREIIFWFFDWYQYVKCGFPQIRFEKWK